MKVFDFLNNLKKHKYSNLIAFGIFLMLSLVLTFGVEFIHHNYSLLKTIKWSIFSLKIFLANWAVVFLFMLVFYAICGCIYVSSTISYFALLILSFASYYKERFRGEPVFPWDLLIKKEGMNIFPMLNQKKAFIVLFAIIFVSILTAVLRFYLPKLKLRYYQRILIGVLALFLLTTVSYIKPVFLSNMLSKQGIGEIGWNQKENYKKNGVVLSFFRNIKNSVVSKPEGYSEANVIKVLNENIANKKEKPQNPQNPNIIFVMSEAFWDPTKIKSISFETDPIPTFHEIQKSFTTGNVISPQYGGLTANVEFEVLTGNSLSFLPKDSIPYQQYVKKSILSIPNILKEQGYATAAVHSYLGWFWNRNNVYQNMGFDTFISSEKMKSPKYKGLYISDDEVTKEIINQIESNKKPVFVYAVTMQNHGPYDGEKRYKKNEIKVKGKLSEYSKYVLETYAQGINDADKALKTLMDFASKSQEPTVVVFFGDHLPLLGYDYWVYTQTGYIPSDKEAEWSLEDFKKMRSVPFVIWTNYKQERQVVENISDSFFGVYVLKMLGKELPPYFKFLDSIYKTLPGCLKELKIDSKGGLHGINDKTFKKIEDQYWLLQYDRLFGKNFQEKVK